MLRYHGRLSLFWFLSSLTANLLPWIIPYDVGVQNSDVWWILPSYFVLSNLLIKCLHAGFSYQVACRSVLLGTIFAAGIHISTSAPQYWYLFGWYCCVISFFHYSEFLAIAWCNPGSLSVDSFILNHSAEYGIAALTSWLEFAITAYYLPSLKGLWGISLAGVVLCLLGEFLRKTAMVTAGTSFDHIIQTDKEKNHQLVTKGVYGYCRHPSYVGWFYWSLGTQLILVNPICTVGYVLASWRFFRERIENEERTLLCFFGEEYMEYQSLVGTGLPGIRGHLLDE